MNYIFVAKQKKVTHPNSQKDFEGADVVSIASETGSCKILQPPFGDILKVEYFKPLSRANFAIQINALHTSILTEKIEINQFDCEFAHTEKRIASFDVPVYLGPLTPALQEIRVSSRFHFVPIGPNQETYISGFIESGAYVTVMEKVGDTALLTKMEAMLMSNYTHKITVSFNGEHFFVQIGTSGHLVDTDGNPIFMCPPKDLIVILSLKKLGAFTKWKSKK